MRIGRARRWWSRPSRSRSSVAILAAALLGAGLATSAPACRRRPEDRPDRTPRALDGRLIRLGRAYLPELGRVYATAWYEGARRLEDGQSIASALKAVGKAWDAGRVRLFDRLVTPEFSAIVPQDRSRPRESDDERKALARAWRGFAAGLETSGR